MIARSRPSRPTDAVDSVTKTDLISELELATEANDAQYYERDLNVIASPAQEIREVFDLMPTATAENWQDIAKRLGNVGGAVDGYIETLRKGMADGVVPARRQVVEVAVQARKHADPLGFFFDMTGGAKLDDDGELPDALKADLRKGAESSADAYGQLAEFLETELAPVATEQDGVGRELYALRSRVVPRREDRPRRDLRLGPRGAPADGRRAERDRERDQVRRQRRGGDRVPRTRTSRASSTAPTRCRSGCRRRATRPWPSSPVTTSTSPTR